VLGPAWDVSQGSPHPLGKPNQANQQERLISDSWTWPATAHPWCIQTQLRSFRVHFSRHAGQATGSSQSGQPSNQLQPKQVPTPIYHCNV